MGFKKDFVWGTASSAYQIEGATFENSKGLNIWDVFSHEDGNIFQNHNGDIACDHFHRVDDDVALMVKMGLKAYRFSIAWARILPNGVGEISQKGIEFYNYLINKLIENNIQPYLTLYHWDLPYALQCKGGWQNPEIANWFGEYAKVVALNFSDRVQNFITINEPQIITGLGYGNGTHAPGFKLPASAIMPICHNILMAHGMAVKTLREYSKKEIKVGISMATTPIIPEKGDTTKYDICEVNAQFPIEGFMFSDSIWLDPIFFGEYPDHIKNTFSDVVCHFTKEQMELINQPIDFIGTNIYTGKYTVKTIDGKIQLAKNKIGYSKTSFNWVITPEALYWGPKLLFDRYKKPIYITENGMACHDTISLDGKVHDPNRIDYINRYLLEMKKAVDEGIEVDGYFAWSFCDNFEWGEGYNERFGLVYIDYETQERIIKDSGCWYKEVIDTNGENL